MKKRSDDWDLERQKIIGLGEDSSRKSYYPQLQTKLMDLEKFNILLNKISDGIVLVKLPSLIVEDINEAASEFFRFSRSEIISNSFKDYADKKLINKFNKVLETEIYKNQPVTFSVESELKSQNENTVPVEISVDIRTHNNEHFAIVLIRNITEKKQSESNLWLETQFRNLIIDNAGYAIICTDKNGIIKIFNKAAEDLLGYNAEEMIDVCTPIVFHDVDEVMFRAVEFSEQIGEKISIGFDVFVAKTKLDLPNEHEWTYITKDKRKKRVLLKITAVQDQQKNITGYVGQAMDLTQLRGAEKDLHIIATNISRQTGMKFFKSMVEYIAKTIEMDYVIIGKFDENDRKIDTLAVWRDQQILRNYSYDLEGTPCQKVIESQDEFFSNELLREFPENKSLKKRKLIGYFGIPLFNSEGKLIGIIALMKKNQINESKRSASILKIFAARSSSELERLLAEQDLLEAKNEAEVADRLKSEFLAQMSHEIRTPINSILNFTGLIKSEIYEASDDDIKTSFNIIDNSGKRLIRTIDSILQMAQIQTGSIEVFPKIIDINLILEKLYHENRLSATNKNINLIIQREAEDSNIYADDHTITQLFENLINNAIKYTEEGFVKIISKNDLDGNFIVEIVDSGIGISDDYKDKLFVAFTQEEQGYTRKFEGNGLGLALVENYCRINNAQIEVESEKGKGSTFRIIFKLEYN